MAAIKGKTGNPGQKNPKKKSATSFTVEPGKEPKGRMMGFRPSVSLEGKIDQAVEASGLKLTEWLEKAAIAYLQQNPPEPTGGEEPKTEITES